MIKKGFSLAEALVVMAVVSIFFALATKVIAVKPKNKVQNNPHGYFECYLDDGHLKQHSVAEGTDSSVLDKSEACDFYPATGVAFFNIHTYGPVYYIGFEPNISNAIKINVSSTALSMQGGGNSFAFSTTDESAKGNTEIFLKVFHSDSKMYNGGAIRTGVMISW